MRNPFAGGMESEIVEYVVRSRVECATLCAANFMCSDINAITSSAGAVTCQLVMNGGNGQAVNITTYGQVYHIYNRN